MNDAQLIERLAGTDAFAADVPVPDEVWTPDVALRELERRTGMQTDERTSILEAGGPPPDSGRPLRRWLVPALAAGIAVVVAVVMAVAVFGNEDEPLPDQGNTTVPATTATTVGEPEASTAGAVGAALDAAATGGDWETVLSFFSPDATVTLGPGTEGEGAVLPWAGPQLGSTATFGSSTSFERPLDWDEDLVRTGFDAIAHDVVWAYAMGVSFFGNCSETDVSTLTCEIGWPEHPLGWAEHGVTTYAHTVRDGIITESTIDATERSTTALTATDPEGALEYEAWVTENRPELNDDGALFRLSPGELVISPDTVERHRQLIAEWVAQR